MSIIARNSFSTSGSSGDVSFVFAFAFDLYAALARGGGFGASSSSSSSEMTTPFLTRAALLVDSARLDVDDSFARVLAVADASSSESETFDLEGLGSTLGTALNDAFGGGSSTGSTLILRVSGAGLGGAAGAGGFTFALLKSSFPEGFAGFAGSSLIADLTSFGSDLMTGFAPPVIEGAFDRPGSLFLEVEAVVEGFAFDEDRLCWRSVRFCETNTVIVGIEVRGGGGKDPYFDVQACDST